MGTYKKRYIIILVLAVIAVASSFLIFAGKQGNVDSQFVDGDAETTVATKGKGKAKAGQVVVYVTGAVGQPGLYTLSGQLRVSEVVELVGGLLPDADVNKVNMARVVKDGMHINIPFMKKVKPSTTMTSAKQIQGQQNLAAEPVHVNRATAAELAGVNGISPALAAKIVEYRANHGAYVSLEDLLNVKGFSPKRLHQLQDKIAL